MLESASKSGDIVIVTSELDQDGLPIIVSVRPDGTGQYNRTEIAGNFITSMYGKNGFEEFISKAIEEERVLYNNKKRTRTLFANAGLQLPRSLTRDGFFKDKVAQVAEDVNGKYSLKAGTESKSAAELRRRNRELENQLTYWRGQVQRTKVPTTNRADVAKTARELLRDTGARMDALHNVQKVNLYSPHKVKLV